MKQLKVYVEEKLSDVEGKWTPPEGLFSKGNPEEIAKTLLDNSEDESQAMKRLVFYMNRAGEDCPNKTVLNKAKEILKQSNR